MITTSQYVLAISSLRDSIWIIIYIIKAIFPLLSFMFIFVQLDKQELLG